MQVVMSNTYQVPKIGYDGIGNIMELVRMGQRPSPQNCFEPGLIDDLGYTYDTQSGHLLSVRDGAPSGFKDYGFKDGAPGNDYTYDDNGNLIQDNNKNLSFTYNYLNLPKTIGQASFLYDADGTKWRKIGEDGITEYANGIIFKNGSVEAIMGKSGRLVAEGTALSQGMRAEYWHQDHLGNTRLAFSDYVVQDGVIETQDDPNTPQNDIEITQELHYYPFGMEQLGSWYGTVAPDNDYRYNGKELNEDYGMDLYEYGFRWYDAAIGRFTGVDPIADEFPWVNTYNYAENEPVANIDLHGLQQGGNMFTSEIKSRIENMVKGAQDDLNSAVNNAGEKLSNVGEGIRKGYSQAKDYIESKLVGNQGSPDIEDFHDHGSAGGGIQAFSPGGNLNGEGTAPTAAAEEGAEVSILLLEGMFPPGGGSGGMGNDAIERIDNFINAYDNAKQVREKLNEQNREPQEKPKIKWSDGKTTIYEKYRPDEQ